MSVALGYRIPWPPAVISQWTEVGALGRILINTVVGLAAAVHPRVSANPHRTIVRPLGALRRT